MKTKLRLTLRRFFALAVCLMLAFCWAPLQALFSRGTRVSAEGAAGDASVAYLSYTDTSWAVQMDGPGVGGEGNQATVTGAGTYRLSLEVVRNWGNGGGSGITTMYLNITNATQMFPRWAIKLWSLKINGEEVELPREAVTYDENNTTTTRMNIYNEYAPNEYENARSYDDDLTEKANNVFTKEEVGTETFSNIQTVELEFSFMEVGAPIDTAYIAFDGGGLSGHYEPNENSAEVNTYVVGRGTYRAGLEFTSGGITSLNFAALIVYGAATDYPGACINITKIELDGEAIEFNKGFTRDEDGHIRMNLYNPYMSSVPSDARSWDGTTTDATWLMVNMEDFARERGSEIKSFYIEFEFIPIDAREEVTAYLEYADEDWSALHFVGNENSNAVATSVGMNNVGNYQVSLDFSDTPGGAAEGLSSISLRVVDGETYYAGWVLQITEILINDEMIIVLPEDSASGGFLKTFTYSLDGEDMLCDIYNTALDSANPPVGARTVDGIKRDASFTAIQTLSDFDYVENITVNFRFVFAEPEEPVNIDWEDHFENQTHNFYMGLQMSESYIFRNAWCDAEGYGLGSEQFDQLYRTDTETFCGGSFTDALNKQLTEEGENYEVRLDLTEEDLGFMGSSEFYLLFISTDIYWQAYTEGRVTVSDVYLQFDGEYINVEEPMFIAITDGRTEKTNPDNPDGNDYLGIYLSHNYSNFMPINNPPPTESLVIGFTVSYSLVEDPTTLVPPTVTFDDSMSTLGTVGEEIEVKYSVTSENEHLSENPEFTTVITVMNGTEEVEVVDGKFTPGKEGDYVITVQATDELGNTSTATHTVYVSPAEDDVSTGGSTSVDTGASGGCGSAVGFGGGAIGVLAVAGYALGFGKKKKF